MRQILASIIPLRAKTVSSRLPSPPLCLPPSSTPRPIQERNASSPSRAQIGRHVLSPSPIISKTSNICALPKRGLSVQDNLSPSSPDKRNDGAAPLPPHFDLPDSKHRKRATSTDSDQLHPTTGRNLLPENSPRNGHLAQDTFGVPMRF